MYIMISSIKKIQGNMMVRQPAVGTDGCFRQGFREGHSEEGLVDNGTPTSLLSFSVVCPLQQGKGRGVTRS
jgi:hypothetical protein